MIRKIITNFKKVDIDGQQILYEMFYSKVYKTAYFITKDPHLAQDILQETFIKAFKNYTQLKDKDKIEAWLMRITTTTAIDALRKQKIRNHTSLENVLHMDIQMSNDVESEVVRKLLKEIIREHINNLPSNYRVVIILKYVHDLKDQEISELLKLELGTVKSRIHRAKSKIKASVEKEVEFKGGLL